MAGRRVSELSRITDVMPTLEELLAVDPHRRRDGRSLVNLMAGRGDERDREAYAENTYPRSRFGWGELRALRSGRYKLIATTRPELYDLERDPHERHNLIDERPRLASAMLTRLAALGAGVPGPLLAPPAAHADRERRDRLASLGYAGRGRLAEGRDPRQVAADPKDKVGEYNRLTSPR
jgi:arylsulfatase A-like enzyme